MAKDPRTPPTSRSRNLKKVINPGNAVQLISIMLRLWLVLFCLSANKVFCIDKIFECKEDQIFCRWLDEEKVDWETAYSRCIRSGGSLVSYRHRAYIQEWTQDLDDRFLWSNQGKVSNRFQWLYPHPEYVRIGAEEWISNEDGDCVVTDRMTGKYRAVSCNNVSSTLCVIDRIRKARLTNELGMKESNEIRVELVASDVKGGKNQQTPHLVINRTDSSTILECKTPISNYSRSLEFSWLKDGVYYSNNISILKPSMVRDDSKMNSESGIYQKQGTYSCQVREFGSTKVFNSNSIMITYDRIFNGIVTLLVNHSSNADINGIMNQILKIIEEDVMKAQLFSMGKHFNTSWDPLFTIKKTGENISEHRFSLYVDLHKNYQDGVVQHILQNIGREVGRHQRHIQWSVEKADVHWATLCPTLSEPNGLQWPPSWSDSEALVLPNDGKVLCIREDHGIESMGRLCKPDFINGAEFAPFDFKKCNKLENTTDHQKPCGFGFEWNQQLNVCYRVTQPGSWVEALAPCMSDWPEENDPLDFDGLKKIARMIEKDVWLPVRRTSIYGPLLFNSRTPIYDVVVENDRPNWKMGEEECLQMTKEGVLQITPCSGSSLPAFCAHKPSSKPSNNKSNLCPDPWKGYRIHQGRLICFRMIQKSSSMDWNEAEESCRQQGIINGAKRASLITLEDDHKAHLWSLVQNEMIGPAWIGLYWSEIDQKFCWMGVANCYFDHFNWNPSLSSKIGQYGHLNKQGSWSLSSSSDRLNNAICEITIELSVDQGIKLENDLKLVPEKWSIHRMVDDPDGSYSSLAELPDRPWDPLPALDIDVTINCYTDGHHLKTITDLPAKIIKPTGLVSTIHCDGWMGWNPRRFVQTETVLIKPLNSMVFIMIIEMMDYVAIDIQTEIMDRVKRLDSINVSVPRKWISEKRALVRMVFKERQLEHNSILPEHEWLDLLKEAFKSPTIGYKVIDIRSTVACPKEFFNNSTSYWKSVPIGQWAERSDSSMCLPGFIRQCSGNPAIGAYWEPAKEEEIGRVVPCEESPSDIFLTLRKLTDQLLSNETTVSNALDQLSSITSDSWDQPNAVELYEAARLLHVSVEQLENPTLNQFQSVSQTISMMMMSTKNALASVQTIPGFSNSLVETMEELMSKVDIDEEETSFQHSKMVTNVVNSINDSIIGYGGMLHDDTISNGCQIAAGIPIEELVKNDIAILLPIDEIRARTKNHRLSFTVLANAALIDAHPITKLIGDAINNYTVDGPVIMAQVGNKTLSNLSQSIRIFFRSTLNKTNDRICVYWDKEVNKNRGGWSSAGCRHAGSIQGLHICECNHLTPLALLMPYFEDIPDDHFFALSTISIIGCVLSMTSLLAVLLTFLTFKKWRQSLGNKILFNLCLALFFLLGSFILAGHLFRDPRLCKAVSVSTHYFLVSSFTWMLVEAVYQYVTYVVVIGATVYRSRFMWKAAPLAWGLPVIPVFALLIYDPNLYLSQSDFCWMSLDAFYPAVMGPIVTIMLINFSLFLVVLKSVITASKSNGLRSTQSNQLRTWYQFRMAICLFFLLGLTWIFGFLSISDARTVLAYLFCVFNSLQGFVIFVFFVLREKNARRLWSEFVGSEDSKSGSRKSQNTSSQLPDYTSKRVSKFY